MLLDGHYERVLHEPADIEARAAMQLGAYYAGAAIELSMLGAAHACANPLTARYGVTHGVAVSVMLPHVVRWNATVVAERYEQLARLSLATTPASSEGLVGRLRSLAAMGCLAPDLETLGVHRDDLARMAADTAPQMTGKHNPRTLEVSDALALYDAAFAGQ